MLLQDQKMVMTMMMLMTQGRQRWSCMQMSSSPLVNRSLTRNSEYSDSRGCVSQNYRNYHRREWLPHYFYISEGAPVSPVSVCLFLSLLHWDCTVYNVNLLSNLNLCTFKLKRLNKVNFQHGVKRSEVHLNFPPNLTTEIERDQADGGKGST